MVKATHIFTKALNIRDCSDDVIQLVISTDSHKLSSM